MCLEYFLAREPIGMSLGSSLQAKVWILGSSSFDLQLWFSKLIVSTAAYLGFGSPLYSKFKRQA